MGQGKLGIQNAETYRAGMASLAEIFNESSLTSAALAIADPFATEKAAPFNAKMEMAEDALTALAQSVKRTKVDFRTETRQKTVDGTEVEAECRQVTVTIGDDAGAARGGNTPRITKEKSQKAPPTPQGRNLKVTARIVTEEQELYEYGETVEDVLSLSTISGDRFTQVLDWWMFPNGVHRQFTAEEVGVIREGDILDAQCGETVSFSDTQVLENAAFKGYAALQTACLINCMSIGKEAFAGCDVLSKVTLPQCQNVGDEAFSRCTSLSHIALPMSVGLGEKAFQNCTALKSVELPLCMNLGDHAFAGCTSLTEVTLPEVMMLGDGVFAGCESLREISLPNCDDIAENAFTGCSALKKIHLSDMNEEEIGDCEGFQDGFGAGNIEICFDL